jgi:hypothetical protein
MSLELHTHAILLTVDSIDRSLPSLVFVVAVFAGSQVAKPCAVAALLQAPHPAIGLQHRPPLHLSGLVACIQASAVRISLIVDPPLSYPRPIVAPLAFAEISIAFGRASAAMSMSAISKCYVSVR